MNYWLLYAGEAERRTLLRLQGELAKHSVAVDMVALGEWQGEPSDGDIVVVANHLFLRTIAADIKIRGYHVHHGVGSSKNTTYAEKDERMVAEFVASNFAIEEAKRRGRNVSKCVPVGYMEMDELVRGPVEGSGKIVVAPTWNHEFGIGDGWVVDFLRRFAPMIPQEVVVQLHPMTATGYKQQIASEAARHHGVTMAAENLGGLVASFDGANALIGDMGSALFEFLPTGKPVFAYNSFRWWFDRKRTDLCDPAVDTSFDPDDLSFRWRDCFYQFSSMDELEVMMGGVLGGKDLLATKRAARVDMLFGAMLDGKVCERIASYITEDTL